MRIQQWASDLSGDIRLSVRSHRRRPLFALAVVALLGTGIGASTATFSVLDALLLRAPNGVRGADHLARLFIVRDEGMIQTPRGGGGSYHDYLTLREQLTGSADVGAFINPETFDIGRGDGARQVRGQAVSANYFNVLGTSMAAGRPFLISEDRATGSSPVAVISHQLWRSHFRDGPAIDRSIVINGRTLTVIGVTEPSFAGIAIERVDVWVPLAMATPIGLTDDEGGDWRESRFTASVKLVARLAPGVAPQALERQASGVLARSVVADLDPTPSVVSGTQLTASNPARSRTVNLSLWLFIMSCLILVMTAANIANLMLARSAARAGELASRAALGASGRRLVRQAIAEVLCLVIPGTAAGLLVAWWSMLAIRRLPLPPGASRLDARVLSAALLIALLAGLIPALLSALAASRAAPGRAMASGRATLAGQRLRGVLVSVQVAIGLLLLIGTGLFIRSTRNAAAIEPGYDVSRLLVASMPLVRHGYDQATRAAVYEEARERLARIPGVQAVTVSHFAPLAGWRYSTGIGVGGTPLELDDNPYVNWVGAGYFRAVGTRLVRGRDFSAEDRADGPPVIIVNEALARLLASHGDVMQLCIDVPRQLRERGCARVIGVAANQRGSYLDDELAPAMYFSRDQHLRAWAQTDGYLVIRAGGNAVARVAEIRGAIQGLRSAMPFVSVEPLEQRIAPELQSLRVGAALFSVFGVIAALVAAVGLFSIVHFFVSERTAEMAIRKSLGATPGSVLRYVIWRSMQPVALGLAGGLASAYAGARLIESQLFGVPGRDLPSYIAAAVLLIIVSLIASIVPAWSAASVDPARALRAE